MAWMTTDFGPPFAGFWEVRPLDSGLTAGLLSPAGKALRQGEAAVRARHGTTRNLK
jgi:hypothetical protein